MFKSIKLQEYKVPNEKISFLGIASLKSGLVSCLAAGLVGNSLCFVYELAVKDATPSRWSSLLLSFCMYSGMIYYICLFGIVTKNSRAVQWGSRFLFVVFAVGTTLNLVHKWILMQNLNAAVQQGWITHTNLHLKMFNSCCIDLVGCFAQLYLSVKMRQFSRLKQRKSFGEEKICLI